MVWVQKLVVCVVLLAIVSPVSMAQETEAAQGVNPPAGAVDLSVMMSDGAVEFTAAKDWQRKRSKIIKHEFTIKPLKSNAESGGEDEATEHSGRLTVSSAMGSITANVDRWKKQFTQPDGSKTEDHSKIEKMMVAGQQVHFVDITGTFYDQPGGPFGKKIEHPGYRMLAAIVNVKDHGQFFLKF